MMRDNSHLTRSWSSLLFSGGTGIDVPLLLLHVSAKARVTSLPFYWWYCANRTLIRFLHRLRESALHISPSDFVRAGNRGYYHSSWENDGHTTTVGSEIEEGRADLRDGGLLVSNVLIEHCSRLHRICRVRANRSKLSCF